MPDPHNPQQPPPPPGGGYAPQAFPVQQAPMSPVQPVFVVNPSPAAPPLESRAGEPRTEEKKEEVRPELKIVSHSNLFYWWPVWVVGYLMAFITYSDPVRAEIGASPELFHYTSGPGVMFFLTLFLVILITNVAVRGLASGIVILSLILAAVLLAYYDMWDKVLAWMGSLSVHLNMGAYVAFSTLLFGVWALAFLVFDRMSYWLIRPGQITHVTVFGAGSKSYDTDNMVVEKYRDDVFRHWVLGLGAGDLYIQTLGANRERLHIPNVLFIGSKVEQIQHLVATEPDQFGHVTLK